MHLKVKICGVTTLEDALMTARAGVWAIGFNFCKSSPRYITPEAAKSIIAQLPSSTLSVGVFVNESPEEIIRIRALCQLDLVQLSGDEPVSDMGAIGGRLIRTIRPSNISELPSDESLASAEIILLDAPKDQRGLYGGSGNPACAECIAPLKKRGYTVFLAGGITPENAREKALRWCPDGLDIASGVETSPGIKDPQKTQQLFKNIRD